MAQQMPVLFIGHGNPMNAIESNGFTQTLSTLSQRFQKPQAILCVSAHWTTPGAWVTEMENPKTIHDFYGFPQELFDIQYPAPGSPKIAKEIRARVRNPAVQGDTQKWGLDHGTWSILVHVFPKADIPVLQLSIDIQKPGDYHLEIGKQLRFLREQGVLIIGSGNIVHNLRQINPDLDATPFDWSVEFDEWAKAKILEGDTKALCLEYSSTPAGRLSVPTPEHYLPLLYTVGAAQETDSITFIYEGLQNGSISMRSVAYGLEK